jgi:hypothetical protein
MQCFLFRLTIATDSTRLFNQMRKLRCSPPLSSIVRKNNPMRFFAEVYVPVDLRQLALETLGVGRAHRKMNAIRFKSIYHRNRGAAAGAEGSFRYI